MKVTNLTISTGEASYDTKRRRSHELATICTRLSINNEKQKMIAEVKMLPKELYSTRTKCANEGRLVCALDKMKNYEKIRKL